ncbi:MAG: ABC transporter permease [Terriglobales bacterium]
MGRWRTIFALRLRSLLRRRWVEEELSEELEDHLQHFTAEKRAQGLRYAVRQMRRNRGFTLIAAVILALGIGANTAIFSVVEAALLRLLPYPEPQQLMRLFDASPGGRGHLPLDGPDFLDWQRQDRTFASMALYQGYSAVNLGIAGGAAPVQGVKAGTSFFQVLGVKPVLGRAFTSGNHEAVLSHGTWQNWFGGRADVIGKRVQLDEQPHTIAGVMPPGFAFPSGVQQLLTESILLALIGGVLGLAVAEGGEHWLAALTASGLVTSPNAFRLDLPVLGFTQC